MGFVKLTLQSGRKAPFFKRKDVTYNQAENYNTLVKKAVTLAARPDS